MAIDDIKLFKERVTLRTLLVSLAIVALGIALLYVSAHKDWLKGYEVWRTVIQQLGGLLFVTVAITLLWELFGKRAFLDEVLAKMQISKEITLSGITKITDSFYHDIDWKSYFQTVHELDIFFAYAGTWRHTHVQELREVANREDARIRVVLPDPENKQTVCELARRFNLTSEELKGLIKGAETDFRGLRPSIGTKGAQIDIWFLPAAPLFSFYLFDRIGILVLYSHSQERARFLTFVCEM